MPTPNPEPYLNSYRTAKVYLRETRNLLAGFHFSLDEIEELMREIGYYLSRLETVNQTVSILDSNRNQLMGTSDFSRRMEDMHLLFAEKEREHLSVLKRKWRTQPPFASFLALPHPISAAEFQAFRSFMMERYADYMSYWRNHATVVNSPALTKLLDDLEGDRPWQRAREVVSRMGRIVKGNVEFGVSSLEIVEDVLDSAQDALDHLAMNSRFSNIHRLAENRIITSGARFGKILDVVSTVVSFQQKFEYRKEEGDDTLNATFEAGGYALGGLAGSLTGAKLGIKLGGIGGTLIGTLIKSGGGTIAGGIGGAILGGIVVSNELRPIGARIGVIIGDVIGDAISDPQETEEDLVYE